MAKNNNSFRDLNLVRMMLNLEDNNFDDYDKIRSVYDIYANLDELKINSSFKNSLIKSKLYLSDDFDLSNELTNLKKNNPNSFLLLPILADGHLWSGLIRKNDEGFSCISINKGSSYFHDPFEEFVFEEKNVNNLIDSLNFAHPSKDEDIEDIYKHFKKNSDKAYNLKLDAAPQKVGNCFTKNIQAGIKFAAATCNHSFEKLAKYRLNSYTPYGTNSTNKKKLKWQGLSTEEMQKIFSNAVAKNNPHIKNHIQSSLKTYSQNKHFRQLLKEDASPTKSLFTAFDPQNKTKGEIKAKRIANLISNLTLYNFENYTGKIESIVEKANDAELKEAFNSANTFLESSEYISNNDAFLRYLNAGHDPIKSLVKIFDNTQTQDLYGNLKIKKLLPDIMPPVIEKCKESILKILSKAYPNQALDNIYSTLLKDAEKKQENIMDNLSFANENIEQTAAFFPDVVEKLEESINNSILNSKLLQKSPQKGIVVIP